MSLSHNGDNLHDLPSLPEVAPSVTVRSPFRYRYALNYCTYNYTYSFYDWNDWERELDWMALNGVNLMLALWEPNSYGPRRWKTQDSLKRRSAISSRDRLSRHGGSWAISKDGAAR